MRNDLSLVSALTCVMFLSDSGLPFVAVCHNDFSSIKQRKLACQRF